MKFSVYFNDEQKLFPTGIILSENDVDFLKKNKTGLSGRIKNDEQRDLWNSIYGQEYFDALFGKSKETDLCRAQKANKHFFFKTDRRLDLGLAGNGRGSKG